MHNESGWSDWSQISTGNVKVKGLPPNFFLVKSGVTENSITLNTQVTFAEPTDAQCTITENHILDMKQPGGRW
jgi:hypothetical protein